MTSATETFAGPIWAEATSETKTSAIQTSHAEEQR
jgi:hypothetical protein